MRNIWLWVGVGVGTLFLLSSSSASAAAPAQQGGGGAPPPNPNRRPTPQPADGGWKPAPVVANGIKPGPYTVVTADAGPGGDLMIRDTPTTDGSVLGRAPRGSVLIADGSVSAGWMHVSNDQQVVGWSATKYLRAGQPGAAAGLDRLNALAMSRRASPKNVRGVG